MRLATLCLIGGLLSGCGGGGPDRLAPAIAEQRHRRSRRRLHLRLTVPRLER